MIENRPDESAGQGLVRKDGTVSPFNAGDAIAAIVDVCQLNEIPLAPQVRARLGKGAKALLESGFKPDIVVAAGVTAVRAGWFGSIETIAQEMVVAKAGQSLSRQEYRSSIGLVAKRIETGESEVWRMLRQQTGGSQ